MSPAGEALLGEAYAAVWTNQGAEIVRNTQPNDDRYRRSKADLSTVVEFEGAGGPKPEVVVGVFISAGEHVPDVVLEPRGGGSTPEKSVAIAQAQPMWAGSPDVL